MYTKETRIINASGLHARPASDFVALAKTFESKITICNLDEYPDEPSNAKSILDLLMLTMVCGTRVRLSAEGADEQTAVDSLVGLIDSGIGE